MNVNWEAFLPQLGAVVILFSALMQCRENDKLRQYLIVLATLLSVLVIIEVKEEFILYTLASGSLLVAIYFELGRKKFIGWAILLINTLLMGVGALLVSGGALLGFLVLLAYLIIEVLTLGFFDGSPNLDGLNLAWKLGLAGLVLVFVGINVSNLQKKYFPID